VALVVCVLITHVMAAMVMKAEVEAAGVSLCTLSHHWHQALRYRR
jgi:hypothetical protein